MDMGELAVAIFETIQRNRRCRPSRTAADLGNAEFEAVGQIDADAVFGAGYRIADRLTGQLEDPRYADAPPPRLDIDLEFDRPEQRLQLVWAHRCEHPPDRGHLVGFLPGHDLLERVALGSIGTLI